MGLREVPWIQVADKLWMAEDSCTVYALEGDGGWVVVNAGTGAAASGLRGVHDVPVLAVLLTHHFRDHSAGAPVWKELGAEIWAPYWEQEYFHNPTQHWVERQIWNSYDNRWDHMAPIAPIAVDHWLMDYAAIQVGGLDIEVIPTPAQSYSAVSFHIRNGAKRYLAVGELMHSPGKVFRIAPMQYNYNDLNGAYNLHQSLGRLATYEADLLLPSKGRPFDKHGPAMAALQKNIEAFAPIVPELDSLLHRPLHRAVLTEFLPNFYFVSGSVASTHFYRAKSGKMLTIDYGYAPQAIVPGKSTRSTRRPLLLAREELIERFGSDRIDLALVSHYHDDHVNGLALIQRLYGTEVWAGANFADILERPDRYDRPCLWHEPVKVARKCPMFETMQWEDIEVRLYPMSGHTRFATLIELRLGDATVIHTGDQTFFTNPPGKGHEPCPESRLFSNHVYKNGLDLGCYYKTLEYIEQIQPDWVITGHTPPYPMNDSFYKALKEGADLWEIAHRAIMPLGEEDVHFGAESLPAKLYPYRVELDAAETIQFEAWVLNPFPYATEGIARIASPGNWPAPSVRFSLPPRGKAEIELTLEPPEGAICSRLPVALDLWIGDRPFGQVAEALVSIGPGKSWYPA